MDFLISSAWLLIPILATILAVFFYSRKANARKKAKTDVPGGEEESVSFSKLNDLIEQERTRIASELHDELGTLLSVIHLDLELVLRESAALTPYGEARLLEIRKNLNLVIEAIRHNIWSLAPQMLDQVQLDFALRELCRKLDAYKGTHLHFVQSGMPFPISHKQKLNLFRIVQELLTNAIKHSSAWNISVQLHWDDTLLTIVVEDDGSAYERAEPKPVSDGMGATNIVKRANLIGATMVRQQLPRGMKITIELKKGSVETNLTA